MRSLELQLHLVNLEQHQLCCLLMNIVPFCDPHPSSALLRDTGRVVGDTDTRVIRHLLHRLQAVCAARNVKMQCTQNSCGSIHNRKITPVVGGKYNMINFNW